MPVSPSEAPGRPGLRPIPGAQVPGEARPGSDGPSQSTQVPVESHPGSNGAVSDMSRPSHDSTSQGAQVPGEPHPGSNAAASNESRPGTDGAVPGQSRPPQGAESPAGTRPSGSSGAAGQTPGSGSNNKELGGNAPARGGAAHASSWTTAAIGPRPTDGTISKPSDIPRPINVSGASLVKPFLSALIVAALATLLV